MKLRHIDWKFVLWHSYGLCIVASALFALVAVVSVVVSGQIPFVGTRGDQTIIADFVQFYTAASLGAHLLGANQNLYDPAVQLSAANVVISPQVLSTPFIFQYPPHVFLMLAPLSAFPILLAWGLSNLLGLILLCSSMLIATVGFKPASRVFIIAAVLVSAPALNCVVEGQILSPVLMLGLTLVWWLLRRQRYFAAGLATLFGILKPQYLPLLVLIGWLLGRWQYAKGALVAAGLLMLAGLTAYGTQSTLNYPAALLSGESTPYAHPAMMCNVRGLLLEETHLPDAVVAGVSAGVMLSVSILVLVVWMRFKDVLKSSTPNDFLLLASLTTLLLPIVSLHTYQYDYLMVAPAFVWICSWLDGAAARNFTSKCSAVIVKSIILASPFITLVNGSMAGMCYLPISLAIVILCVCIVSSHARRQANPSVCSLVH